MNYVISHKTHAKKITYVHKKMFVMCMLLYLYCELVSFSNQIHLNVPGSPPDRKNSAAADLTRSVGIRQYGTFILCLSN